MKCTGPNWPGGLKSAPGQRAGAYVEGWPIVIVAIISTSMPNLVLVSKSALKLHIWELSHWTIKRSHSRSISHVSHT